MSPSPKFANEIQRLMRDPDALRDEAEHMRRSGGGGHYDPNQPRVPAGDPRGGLFASGGNRGGDSGRDAVKPIKVGFELAHHPIPPGWENDGHFGNIDVARSPGVFMDSGDRYLLDVIQRPWTSGNFNTTSNDTRRLGDLNVCR